MLYLGLKVNVFFLLEVVFQGGGVARLGDKNFCVMEWVNL